MKTATLAQGNQVMNLILQKQVPAQQLQQLLESGLISDLLDANVARVDRAEFRELIGLTPYQVKVEVRYYDSREFMLRIMLRTCGGELYCGDEISIEDVVREDSFWSENPLEDKTMYEQIESVIIDILPFEGTLPAILSEMDDAAYRPATFEELLSLGRTDPELQKKFPIASLARLSRFKGKNVFPGIGLRHHASGNIRSGAGNIRAIHFFEIKNDEPLSDFFRFAVVRKKQ